MDDAHGEAPATAQQESPTVLLSAALARKFHEDHYADSYLARRCRVGVEVVVAWKTGAAVPDFRNWWYLLRVHRSFDRLTDLWRRTARDAGVPTEDPEFVGDRRQREAPIHAQAHPPAIDLARPVERIMQTTRVIEVRAPEEADPPGLTPREPASAPAAPSAPPSQSTSGTASELAIGVPSGFVVYRCRITRGRILELPLPVDMTSADVDRICAFLRTQVDDDGREGGGDR